MTKPLFLRVCYLIAVVGTAAIALPGISGCGGDGDCCRRTLTAPTTRAVRFDIAWGNRSRHVDSPDSAQSVRIRFIAAGADARTVSLVLDRPAGTAAVVQNVTVDQEIRTGSQEVIMQFHTERGGSGAVVGVARAFVNIGEDGTGLDDFAVAGAVRTVSLPATFALAPGAESELPVTARNADGDILALSPGSVFLTVRGGGDSVEITPDGRLRAKAPGTAAVVALVDGVESDASQVTVSAGAVNPRFTINWAARSRFVNAVASARSCRVTLPGGSPTGGDVVLPVVNRRPAPEAYSQGVEITAPVVVGSRTFTAQFFADADGQGALVGVASGTLPVNSDGSGLDTFTLGTAATVTSCEVVPGQIFATGSTLLLNFTARDKDGNIVVVSPGSAFWTQVEGDAIQVLQDGSARAAISGEVKVRVSVDGTISEPATVRSTNSKGDINVDLF